MFDLLQICPLLRQHVASDKVGFGVNHRMRDFKQNKKKNLDLVISTRRNGTDVTFADLADKWGVVLSAEESAALSSLPVMKKAAVSNVFLALEAKACMTEHIKAISRLNDELSASFQTIHGDTGGAIAAAFIMINCADSFISPKRNTKRVRMRRFVVTKHNQPHAADSVVDAMMKITRRSDSHGQGFDAIGITMARCVNDGTLVEIDRVANVKLPPIATYTSLLERLAHLYATKYSAI
jgi:hypothetical protein